MVHMYKELKVINLPSGVSLAENLGEVFVLKTCQRTMIVGLGMTPDEYLTSYRGVRDMLHGNQAYEFLLETICGLKSQLVAENEIVAQFRDAYKAFMTLPFRNTQISNVIEKLFKDSKEVRTKHLLEVGQHSYAGITRKMIHQFYNEGEVLVLGSGKLADDVVKLLMKRYNVFVSARNEEKLDELLKKYPIQSVDWNDKEKFCDFSIIVNTIGADEILFGQVFFEKWCLKNELVQHKLFIDLGSPSAVSTPRSIESGIYRLHEVFKESEQMSEMKLKKVEAARELIGEIVQKRMQNKNAHSESQLEARELCLA